MSEARLARKAERSGDVVLESSSVEQRLQTWYRVKKSATQPQCKYERIVAGRLALLFAPRPPREFMMRPLPRLKSSYYLAVSLMFPSARYTEECDSWCHTSCF